MQTKENKTELSQNQDNQKNSGMNAVSPPPFNLTASGGNPNQESSSQTETEREDAGVQRGIDPSTINEISSKVLSIKENSDKSFTIHEVVRLEMMGCVYIKNSTMPGVLQSYGTYSAYYLDVVSQISKDGTISSLAQIMGSSHRETLKDFELGNQLNNPEYQDVNAVYLPEPDPLLINYETALARTISHGFTLGYGSVLMDDYLRYKDREGEAWPAGGNNPANQVANEWRHAANRTDKRYEGVGSHVDEIDFVFPELYDFYLSQKVRNE